MSTGANTAEMPLKGGKEAAQKNLLGQKTTDKPDPLVVERARTYADALDQIERYKDKAAAAYSDLESAFKKSKRMRRVSIQTEWGSWVFWAESGQYKVKKKREMPVK